MDEMISEWSKRGFFRVDAEEGERITFSRSVDEPGQRQATKRDKGTSGGPLSPFLSLLPPTRQP